MFNESFSNYEIDNIKDYLIYIEDDLNLITNTNYSQGSKEITIKGEKCKGTSPIVWQGNKRFVFDKTIAINIQQILKVIKDSYSNFKISFIYRDSIVGSGINTRYKSANFGIYWKKERMDKFISSMEEVNSRWVHEIKIRYW